MQALQLYACHFLTLGHAFRCCIQRLFVRFALGPGEMLQICGKGEPLGARQRFHFTLNLQQCHSVDGSR